MQRIECSIQITTLDGDTVAVDEYADLVEAELTDALASLGALPDIYDEDDVVTITPETSRLTLLLDAADPPGVTIREAVSLTNDLFRVTGTIGIDVTIDGATELPHPRPVTAQ